MMVKKNNNTVNKFDSIIYLVAIVGPLLTLPQIVQIFSEKSASGVSLLTWVAYLIMALLWTIYGIKKKDKAITINNALWAFFELLVITGVIIYR